MTREPIAIVSQSQGPVAEAYRSLRVALSTQLNQGKSCFTLVSAWPGDGKSMVCTNIAIALGQLHQRVLLVDGDLRRPTISRVFGAQAKCGLTDDLEANRAKSEGIYPTVFPNTFLLPRGLSEKNPANLLGPDRLARLFRSLRSEFDCVILDSPPLSACSDALLLGSHSDGALMVVSPKGWDGEVELRYKQQLEEHGITLLGVVLNGAQGGESHGYGYGYGYGRTYGKSYGPGYGYYGNKDKPAAKRGISWPWTRPDGES